LPAQWVGSRSRLVDIMGNIHPVENPRVKLTRVPVYFASAD
jgi:hypothetical protein